MDKYVKKVGQTLLIGLYIVIFFTVMYFVVDFIEYGQPLGEWFGKAIEYIFYGAIAIFIFILIWRENN